jgi:hypothetical protein
MQIRSFFLSCTSADQVVPVTRGGSDDPANLVTACWMCNGTKSNFLMSELPRWALYPSAGSPWRGLTEHLEAMMAHAGLQKNLYLRRWAEAIRNPEPLN